MCKYVTHLRTCYVCLAENTVLISEKMCAQASRSGVFGTCGRTQDEGSKTPYQCWGCKENVLKISSKTHHGQRTVHGLLV